MFNPFRKSIFLSSLVLLLSPLTSCLNHNQTIPLKLSTQPVLEEIIKTENLKPENNPSKSYEYRLAEETENSMESFYQYWQTYPSIPDSGLILNVSDIPYEAPEDAPGLGKYAYDLEAYYSDTRNIAPQVQGTLMEYGFSDSLSYEEIMKIPMMGSRHGYGYRNNSFQTPAGLYELQALMTEDPFDYYNGFSYLSSAVFEFHNINPEYNYYDEEYDEEISIYQETNGWNNPSQEGRGIYAHGPNWTSTIEGLGSGGCIRAYPELMSEIGYLVDSLSGDWLHHPETQVPFYIYVQAPFDKKPELDQDIIISTKTSIEFEYLAEQ
jgi:hypothetical protein